MLAKYFVYQYLGYLKDEGKMIWSEMKIAEQQTITI